MVPAIVAGVVATGSPTPLLIREALGKSRKNASRARKVRVRMRGNRQTRTRTKDWTRRLPPEQSEQPDEQAPRRGERVVAKGDLSRKRTVIEIDPDRLEALADDPNVTGQPGLVLSVHGAFCEVAADGGTFRCYVRRVLRNLLIEERQPVAAGDHVRFRCTGRDEGVIASVDPRRTALTRVYRHRVHTVVANMDQIVVVASMRQPPLKTTLIDRYLVAADLGDVAAIVCLNKVDLDADGRAHDVAAMYRHIGYPVVLASALTGQGVDTLGELFKDRRSVVAGHSGVGKSSLLNRLQPGLDLRVREVSEATLKGKHTTALTRLIPLQMGGYVADTPGVRQFALWKADPKELADHFAEFASVAGRCPFPNCRHLNEQDCAVKRAVDQGRIHPDRYQSYVRLLETDE